MSGMELVDVGLDLLDETECHHLLHQAQVGRVALALEGVPVVLPVNFVMVGAEITFFTGPGLKLDAARNGSTVSFEVDDLDPVTRGGWSVLAVGHAGVADAVHRARAEALGLTPWVAGERHELVRIRPTFLSGRRIRTGLPGAI